MPNWCFSETSWPTSPRAKRLSRSTRFWGLTTTFICTSLRRTCPSSTKLSCGLPRSNAIRDLSRRITSDSIVTAHTSPLRQARRRMEAARRASRHAVSPLRLHGAVVDAGQHLCGIARHDYVDYHRPARGQRTFKRLGELVGRFDTDSRAAKGLCNA